MAELLKGVPVAKALTEETAKKAALLREKGIVPTLALLRVGERAEDLAYEKQIIKRCEEASVALRLMVFAETEAEEFVRCFHEQNNDPAVHGIMWFRPLPKEIDGEALRRALDPSKDVDGCTDGSLAGVFAGRDVGFAPCTAQAVMEVLHFYGVDPKGKRAVVLGRSLVVGRPVGMLLMHENATVTICHTKTENAAAIAREAEILVGAVGQARMVAAEYVNPSQTVIDVGINWDAHMGKLVGDVDFEVTEPLVRAITPVPSGVGSVTTAVLCSHVVESADKLNK
jgi:methylenetetrahydrofolate dehydrogenase (NADP+)/methenyltetrahydrofolate cyclohydrolase